MIERSELPMAKVWRITLVLVLLTQAFMLTIHTPLGARTLPAALVKVGFLRPRQVGFLLKGINPDENGVVRSLAREVRQRVSPGSHLEIVWSGTPLIVEPADLAYQLYPQTFTQRAGVPGDLASSGCRIDWQPEVDVMLSCPGSEWRYQANAEASR